MRGKVFRKTVIFLVVAVFSLTSVLVLAAEKQEKQLKQEKQWVVIKDKAGKCSVHQTTKGKTPKSIAGPFATKEQAEAEKAKLCPKPEKPKKEMPSPTKK
jgi:hypothetical protein